ncbi:MAG: tRNA-guanine transglycosylase, partial [Phycisphaerae bacterium]
SRGQMRLRNAQVAEDPRPIEEGCDCEACRTQRIGDGAGHFSRSYLRHLFMADEMLGPMLVTLHNLRHFQRFMADLRATIRSDGWPEFLSRWPVAAGGFDGADAGQA